MHGNAACVMLTVLPATVTVPVRAVAAVFAATISVAVQVPDPEAGVTVIQDAPDTAVQPQPTVDVIPTATVPPPLATDAVSGDTV